MKIGIVTTWYERGASYVSRQYKEILESEHEIFIYARGGDNKSLKNDPIWDVGNITWGSKPFNPIPTSVRLKELKKWVINNRLDVVLFNEQHDWEPVIVCKKLGVIIGAYIDYYTEETVSLFTIYDFLLCNTKRHFSVFKWHPQVFYVPWGTDISLFKPVKDTGLESNELTFFHSAGFNPHRKGTDLLISAFAEVREKAKLVIHTQVDLYRFFPHLQEILTKMIDEGRIVYVYKTIPAPGLYYLGDVYVYPARLDGLGLTLAEAGSCGLPIITGDEAPFNEFVNHQNGRVVAIDQYISRSDGYYWPQSLVDVNDLREKLSFYIENKENIGLFKRQARDFAEKHFNWQDNKDLLLSIFEKVNRLPLDRKVKEDIRVFQNRKVPLQRIPGVLSLAYFASKITKRG